VNARRILLAAVAVAAVTAIVVFTAFSDRGPRVALRVVVPPGRGGIVAGGHACAASCTFRFAKRARVRVTARPGRGFRFAGWSGACAGSGSCTIALARPRSVSARFAPLPRDVSWNSHARCKPVVTTLAAVVGSVQTPEAGAAESGGRFQPHFRGDAQRRQLNPPCSLGGTSTFVEIDDLVATGEPWEHVDDGDWVGQLMDPNRANVDNAYLKRIYAEMDVTWDRAHVAPLPPPAVGQHVDVQGFVYWDTGHTHEAWHSFSGWELHALAAWRPAVHPR
jgi:hypothetical protein